MEISNCILVVVLLSVTCGISTCQKCSLVINEINTDFPGEMGTPDKEEFIELKLIGCGPIPLPGATPRISLQKYIVIIVKEYDAKFRGPSIVFSADLYHSSIP